MQEDKPDKPGVPVVPETKDGEREVGLPLLRVRNEREKAEKARQPKSRSGLPKGRGDKVCRD